VKAGKGFIVYARAIIVFQISYFVLSDNGWGRFLLDYSWRNTRLDQAVFCRFGGRFGGWFRSWFGGWSCRPASALVVQAASGKSAGQQAGDAP
jgi:hypothetical protein